MRITNKYHCNAISFKDIQVGDGFTSTDGELRLKLKDGSYVNLHTCEVFKNPPMIGLLYSRNIEVIVT